MFMKQFDKIIHLFITNWELYLVNLVGRGSKRYF